MPKQNTVTETNFTLMRRLKETYGRMEHTPGILSTDEDKIITKDLQLENMNLLALQNMRDFIVLAWDRSGKYNTGKMDEISAITAAIDKWIILNGGDI